MLFPNKSGPGSQTMSRGQLSEDGVQDLLNRFEHLDLDLPEDKIPSSIPLQSQQAPMGITETQMSEVLKLLLLGSYTMYLVMQWSC